MPEEKLARSRSGRVHDVHGMQTHAERDVYEILTALTSMDTAHMSAAPQPAESTALRRARAVIA